MTGPTDHAGWMRRAACGGAPGHLFVTPGDGDDQAPYPSADEAAYCSRCPVRPECLAWALLSGDVGVWGGLTDYQRGQVARTRSRVTCPGCGSRLLTPQGPQVCLCCGLSWAV